MKTETRKAFVAENGTFHCPCGAIHSRGPVNGVDVYRCLKCGSAFRVSGLVELRTATDQRKDK